MKQKAKNKGKINEIKIQFFKKINKMDKPLGEKLAKEKKKKITKTILLQTPKTLKDQ